jgi:hypothetical protein
MSYMGFSLKIMSLSRTRHMRNQVEAALAMKLAVISN